MNLWDRVALNIQELRRARGLSQEELAHRADVSRGYMGKVENVKFAASLDLLERVARALNGVWCRRVENPSLSAKHSFPVIA